MHLSLLPSVQNIADISDENAIILEDDAANKRIKLEEIFREAEKNSQRRTLQKSSGELMTKNDDDEGVLEEAEDGRLNIDQVKEFLFYTREELSVVHDLMSRLLMSSTKDLDHLPDDENNTNLLRLSKISPGIVKAAKNTAAEITSLQYIQYCKSVDRKEFVQSLEKAISDLELIIEKENEFFNEFAFLLMERNWILRRRSDNPSLLYCTYGYRNDGSTFFQPGEADIWRQYHQQVQMQSDMQVDGDTPSTSAIEILTPHSRLCGVDVYLQELSAEGIEKEKTRPNNQVQIDWSKSIYLSDENMPDIVKPLVTSRIAVFEQELFQSLLSSLYADPLLVQKSRISQKSIIIPVSENQCLVVKLDSETDGSEAALQDAQSPLEAGRSVMDDFFSLLCRVSLIHLYEQNRRSLQHADASSESSPLATPVKPPIPYLVNLVKHAKSRQVAQQAFSDLLINTASLKSSLKVSPLSKTSCKWTFSAQATPSRKMIISCKIVNQILSLKSTISTLSNSETSSASRPAFFPAKFNSMPTTTHHPVLIMNQLKSTLFSIMTQFLSDWLYLECKCLYGPEKVIKSTWGLQIYTAASQSLVASAVCLDDSVFKIAILMPDGREQSCTISKSDGAVPVVIRLRRLLLQFA